MNVIRALTAGKQRVRYRTVPNDPSTEPVILVSTTPSGVRLVRWFPDLWSAERNHVTLTASALGVSAHGQYLTDIPSAWIEAAMLAWRALSADPGADVSHMATHVNSVTSNGPLIPVGP